MKRRHEDSIACLPKTSRYWDQWIQFENHRYNPSYVHTLECSSNNSKCHVRSENCFVAKRREREIAIGTRDLHEILTQQNVWRCENMYYLKDVKLETFENLQLSLVPCSLRVMKSPHSPLIRLRDEQASLNGQPFR